jgi:hypothetical protein
MTDKPHNRRNNPPEHTRFKKGISGNPSGKPGPKKLRQRQFMLEFDRACDMHPDTLAAMEPQNEVERDVQKLVLGAIRGDTRSVHMFFALILSDSLSKARRMAAATLEEERLDAEEERELATCLPDRRNIAGEGLKQRITGEIIFGSDFMKLREKLRAERIRQGLRPGSPFDIN